MWGGSDPARGRGRRSDGLVVARAGAARGRTDRRVAACAGAARGRSHAGVDRAAQTRRGAEDAPVARSTETAPVAVYQRIPEAYDSVGSMGRTGLHTQVRVVDAMGAEVGAGVPGEVLVRGEHVAGGYWNDPEGSAKAFAGGWFRSGDIAEVDADGRFWFKDRIKNVIVSGGENIYPAEVERVLRGLPGIRECQVIGRPDRRWGMVPVAVVVADAGLSREAVLAYFHGKLARFKHPRDVVFLDELPKNAMGKVKLDELSRMVSEFGGTAA